MSVLDVLNRPWAILPEKHDALCALYQQHAAGVRFDAKEVAAAIGYKPSVPDDAPYENVGGVAIISVEGVLAKKMNLFTAISGGASTEMLAQAVKDADVDPNVHCILLDIDSPGGEVDGTQQFGDAVAATEKKIIAFADGLCCSAAYWVAAQCDSIYAASDTSTIGSIGVRVKHVDYSKANEQEGVKVTHITAGRYKALGNEDEPLSQEARDYFQGQLDYLCDLFVRAVANGRETDPDTVWAEMGEGRVFFAQQALEAGMIDGIISRENLVSRLSNGDYSPATKDSGPKAGADSMSTAFKTFATEADYNAAIETAVSAALLSAKPTQAQIDAFKAEGAASERARIAAIDATPYASAYPDVIKALKEDGKSGGPEAAVAILAADAKATKGAAAARAAELPEPVSASHPDANTEARQARQAIGQPEQKVISAADIRAHMASAKAAGRSLTPAEAQTELEQKAA